MCNVADTFRQIRNAAANTHRCQCLLGVSGKPRCSRFFPIQEPSPGAPPRRGVPHRDITRSPILGMSSPALAKSPLVFRYFFFGNPRNSSKPIFLIFGVDSTMLTGKKREASVKPLNAPKMPLNAHQGFSCSGSPVTPPVASCFGWVSASHASIPISLSKWTSWYIVSPVFASSCPIHPPRRLRGFSC